MPDTFTNQDASHLNKCNPAMQQNQTNTEQTKSKVLTGEILCYDTTTIKHSSEE